MRGGMSFINRVQGLVNLLCRDPPATSHIIEIPNLRWLDNLARALLTFAYSLAPPPPRPHFRQSWSHCACVREVEGPLGQGVDPPPESQGVLKASSNYITVLMPPLMSTLAN